MNGFMNGSPSNKILQIEASFSELAFFLRYILSLFNADHNQMGDCLTTSQWIMDSNTGRGFVESSRLQLDKDNPPSIFLRQYSFSLYVQSFGFAFKSVVPLTYLVTLKRR